MSNAGATLRKYSYDSLRMSYTSNCIRDKVLCLLFVMKSPSNFDETEYEGRVDPKDENYKKFMDVLVDYVGNLDEDMSDYSKAKMNLLMDMNGIDNDMRKTYMWMLRDFCVRDRIGIIDILKPVELSNCFISLLEL